LTLYRPQPRAKHLRHIHTPSSGTFLLDFLFISLLFEIDWLLWDVFKYQIKTTAFKLAQWIGEKWIKDQN
jgi:hypothetical protein